MLSNNPRLKNPHGARQSVILVYKKCPVCGERLEINADVNIVRNMITSSYINDDGTVACPSCSVILQINGEEVFESSQDTSNDRCYPNGYNPCDSCDVPNNKHLPCVARHCPCIDCDNKGLGFSCNECTLIPRNT